MKTFRYRYGFAAVALLAGGNCFADTRSDALSAAKKAVAFYTQQVTEYLSTK